MTGNLYAAAVSDRVQKMGMASEDLLVTLQILPAFFSNCLFLALYDSTVLVKRIVSLLRCSRSAAAAAAGGSGKWRRMLTRAGIRSIWRSFLLDAYKKVKVGCEAPNSKVVKVTTASSHRRKTIEPNERGGGGGGGGRLGKPDECHLLDLESSGRPLVVNFGSAT